MEQRNGYLRIGVSMRVTKAVDYYEKRDALSQDWQIFISEYLPEAISMPLPNLGKQIIKDVVKEKINEQVQEAKEKVEQKKEEIKQKVEEKKEKVESEVEKVKDKWPKDNSGPK